MYGIRFQSSSAGPGNGTLHESRGSEISVEQLGRSEMVRKGLGIDVKGEKGAVQWITSP